MKNNMDDKEIKCKNCWYYHKNIKKCRLNRSIEMGNVGITVDKNDKCEHFTR